LSKLVRSQSQAPAKTSIPTIPRSSISAMLTSCNEGTELIGNEYFTYNGENKDSKND
jgi:hypothetical protein